MSPNQNFLLEQVIYRHPLVVAPDASLAKVIDLMSWSLAGSCRLTEDDTVLNDSLVDRFSAGYALVIADMQLLGIFTERDIVRLIAAGRVREELTVADVMTRRVITLKAADTQNIFHTLNLMRQHQIQHLPIVDEHDQLLGIITLEALRRTLQPIDLLRLRQVGEVMSTQVIHAPPIASVLQVAQLMAQHQVSCVVIVEAAEAQRHGGIAEQASQQSIANPPIQTQKPEIQASRLLVPNPQSLIPVGIITEQDIVQLLKLDLDLATLQTQTVMSALLLPVSLEDSLWAAHQQMLQHQLRQLVVTGPQGELKGVLTQTTLLQPLDPIEMHRTLELLQHKVRQLESAKSKGLQPRMVELEKQAQTELSERKQVEEDRDRFFSLSPDVLCIIGLDGYFKRLNPAFEATLGFTTEELLVTPFLDLVHPEDRETTSAEIAKLLTGNGPRYFEDRYRCKEGSYKWLLWSATPDLNYQLIYLMAKDITQSKQAEAALRESEHSYRTLAENLPGIVYRVLPEQNNRMIFFNKMLQPLIGFRNEDLTSGEVCSIDPLILPDDRSHVVETVKDAITRDQPFQVEYRIQDRAGDIRYFWEQGRPIVSEGQLKHIDGVILDISDRKRVEIALRQERDFITAILNTVGALIVVLDPQGRIVHFNHACEQITGYTGDEVNGKYIWDILLSPDEVEPVRTIVRRLVAGDFPNQHENSWVTKDGRQRLIDWSNTALVDVKGSVEYIIGTGIDITEHRQAEKRVAEQAALLNIASDAIFVRDMSNRILFWSQGAERLYGWKAKEVIGKEAQELFYRESPSQLEVALNITIEQGDWNGELTQLTKASQEIIVESRWTLMRDERKKPQSILAVNTDITEKKHLEKQLLHAQRLESIGILAGGIAHDLNNILTPILASAQLLPLRFPNADKQSLRLLEMLKASAERGAALVKQVLSFSRSVEGEYVALQVRHLISEVKQIVEETFPKSIELHTNILQDLWTIHGDVTQLHQVLMNLCINARDAMPHGGILHISAENCFIDEHFAQLNLEAHVGPYILITVSDTGVGIPPDILDRIFDPFFTTKEVGQGTGLGLSAVIGVVKKHGGFVKVHSEVGQGAQFQVYLPTIETPEGLQTEDSEPPTGQGELILVVDDEAPIREITQTLLETYNYKVLTASGGIEAISLYAQHRDKINAVLMDMMMPSMDGVATIRTLQRINPRVKIIAVSGLTASDKIAAAMAIGVETFLPKPYTSEVLLKILQDVLSNCQN